MGALSHSRPPCQRPPVIVAALYNKSCVSTITPLDIAFGSAKISHVTIVSRFAPSPTGRIHRGNAASALLAWRFARDRGGRFLLRIEDIDPIRCTATAADGLVEDLVWLGIDWDGPVRRQSEHFADYRAALQSLDAMGLLYPCFCSRRDIAAAGHAPHGPDGPVYPGTCRGIPRAEAEARAALEPHALRLDMAEAAARAGSLEWHDSRLGRVAADPGAAGDVVLARKDVPASYHLAVTIDDALQGVTDVVRGEDLVAATDIHRLLQALLGLPVPRYHHHALLAGADGARLAKRAGSATVAGLRAAGADPRALAAELLASLAR